MDNGQRTMDNIFDIHKPPSGAWIQQNDDETLVLGASTKSLADSLMELPFAIAWTSFVSWAIIGGQIRNGEFSWLITLFGIPFIIAAYYLSKNALMVSFGKIVYTLDEKNLKIFAGIGILGNTKIYSLESLHIKEKQSEDGIHYLSLFSGENIIIHNRLNSERSRYLKLAMQKILNDRDEGRNFLKQDLSEHLL